MRQVVKIRHGEDSARVVKRRRYSRDLQLHTSPRNLALHSLGQNRHHFIRSPGGEQTAPIVRLRIAEFVQLLDAAFDDGGRAE